MTERPMTYAEDLALCQGIPGKPRRPRAFKRYSANGVTRLFSFVQVAPGEPDRREWVLVAKREPGSTWRGVPGLAARLRHAAD